FPLTHAKHSLWRQTLLWPSSVGLGNIASTFSTSHSSAPFFHSFCLRDAGRQSRGPNPPGAGADFFVVPGTSTPSPLCDGRNQLAPTSNAI
ncbi:hypothetical protein BKA93DRAFT_879275, partial [Sparassis latifolia]